MRIIVQRSIPEPLISAEETWNDQADPIKLLRRKPRRQRDPIYSYNDKYGFGPCLHHFAGTRTQQGIPGILPHGVVPYGKQNNQAKAPKQEVIHRIPCIFASNNRCREAFLNAGKQHIFPIGLSSTYANACIATHSEANPSQPEGSIFFRSHSTPAFTDSLDDAATIQWLLALPKRYHPIRISVFPFDWEQGFYTAYTKAGFELVSAGHAYDPAFIWRHLHLIRHHRYTLSTGIGTHVFHAIMCEKPVLIKPTQHDYQAHRRDFEKHLEAKDDFQTLCDYFRSPSESPTRQQIQLSRKWLGQDFTLPPHMLRQKLDEARAIHENTKNQIEASKARRPSKPSINSATQSNEDQDPQTSTNQEQTKQQPFVSICTLTHNRPDCLKRLLTCIEKQTYPLNKIEWLILDDSTDYKANIELKSRSSLKIKYQRLRDKMILGAKRNLSHKLCSGEIIIYMDDDDFYFPERVAHAVDALQKSNKGIAGSTNLHIYFSHDDQLWLSGPFGKNHATANTFAMTKEFASQHFYDDDATCNEEKSFLNNYTIPMKQLDPLQNLICISHNTNTFDKRRMRNNGATRRMRPLNPREAKPLMQQLLETGFRDQQDLTTIQAQSNAAEKMHREQQLPPLALVCGPWGSGTSALCSLLNAIGVHAQGPFYQTNDPRTPSCFEMLAFNNLVNQLVDEKTLKRRHSSQFILDQLITFRDQHLIQQGNLKNQLQLLKTPASSALLPELQQVFSLQLLICLREFKEIEQTRQRRGWPPHLGQSGAEQIYKQLLNFTASSNSPFLFVRYRDMMDQEHRQQLLSRVSQFLSINPSKQQQQHALKAVTR